MKIAENLKKNCHNCEHLEWIDDDSEISNNSGFACHKRDYYKKGDYYTNEQKHLNQLNSEKYRNHGKKCHEKKVANGT